MFLIPASAEAADNIAAQRCRVRDARRERERRVEVNLNSSNFALIGPRLILGNTSQSERSVLNRS